MKWLRRFLLLVAMLALFSSVAGVLSYLVPAVMGILGVKAADVLRLGSLLVALVCGTGLLWLKNWARLGMLVLLAFHFLSYLILFFQMRHLGIDALGYAFIAVSVVVYVSLITLLALASRVASDEGAPASKAWRFAGLVAAIMGGGCYFLSFVDLGSQRLEDLPATGQSAPAELTQASRWRLERIPTAALFDRDLDQTGTAEGTLTLEPRDGVVTIAGIPELRKFHVRFYPGRYAMTVNDMIFAGTPFKSERFLWRALPAQGIRFSNEDSPVKGKLAFGAVSDGTMYIVLELEMYFRDVETIYRARRISSNEGGEVQKR